MDDVEGAKAFRVAGSAYDSFMGRYSGPLALRFRRRGRCHPRADGARRRVRPGRADRRARRPPRRRRSVGMRSVGTVRRGMRCSTSRRGRPRRAGRGSPVRRQRVRSRAGAVGDALRVGPRPGSGGALPGGSSRRVRSAPVSGTSATGWRCCAGSGRPWAAGCVPPVDGGAVAFGGPGELVELFTRAGLSQVTETTLRVTSTYEDFDELWTGFLAGVGPAGTYLRVALR